MELILTFSFSVHSSSQNKAWQYNSVGRILGPRGNSLKKVGAMTESRVYIRGRGSDKDAVKVSWNVLRIPTYTYALRELKMLIFLNTWLHMLAIL